MAEPSPTHIVLNTHTRHVDALAVGPTFTAVATSSLTGDVWDGELTLLTDADVSAPAHVAHSVLTRSGNAGLAWVSAEVLAVGDDRGDVTVWQVLPAAPTGANTKSLATMTPLATFGEHTQPITAVCASAGASPVRVATTSLDGTAKVWAAAVAGGATATLEHLSQKHAWLEVQALSCVWLDGSAQMLTTGASDGVCRVWDVRQQSPAANCFAAHSAPLLAVAPGAAESQLLAASECGQLLLFDQRRPGAPVVAVHVGPKDVPLCALAASPTPVAGSPTARPCVAVGAEDGRVAAVDPRDLHVVASRHVHHGRVGGLAWLGGGALLSGGWDKRVVRWNGAAAAE